MAVSEDIIPFIKDNQMSKRWMYECNLLQGVRLIVKQRAEENPFIRMPVDGQVLALEYLPAQILSFNNRQAKVMFNPDHDFFRLCNFERRDIRAECFI